MLPIAGYDTAVSLCFVVALQGGVFGIVEAYTVDLEGFMGMPFRGHGDKIFHIPFNRLVPAVFIGGYDMLVHIDLACHGNAAHGQADQYANGAEKDICLVAFKGFLPADFSDFGDKEAKKAQQNGKRNQSFPIHTISNLIQYLVHAVTSFGFYIGSRI